MERDEERRFTCCWGRLKEIIPWTRGRRRRASDLLKRQGNNNNGVGCEITSILTGNGKSKTAGIYRYSPLSYAQNFEDHGYPLEDDEDSASSLRFSTRYAVSSSTKSSQARNNTFLSQKSN